MVHIDPMQALSLGWCGWKNCARFMLFTVKFRLMFCNAVSKVGCGKKRKFKVAKENYIF